MNSVWFYSLLSVLIVSSVSLLGVLTISLKVEVLKKLMIYMISFSAGALLGDAFLHLLPELVEETGFTPMIGVYVLVGIGFSFFVEKIIHWRHCHHPTTKEHKHPFAWMNLFGDAVHNFIDGMIIAAAYLVDFNLGVATTLAVVMHEIPQEIGDFGVLIAGGFSKGKALLLNFLTALVSVLGAVVVLSVGGSSPEIIHFLVPFAVGGFIYIAAADLIPELHKETNVAKSICQFFWFVVGVAVMWGLLFVGHGHHDHGHETVDVHEHEEEHQEEEHEDHHDEEEDHHEDEEHHDE